MLRKSIEEYNLYDVMIIPLCRACIYKKDPFRVKQNTNFKLAYVHGNKGQLLGSRGSDRIIIKS